VTAGASIVGGNVTEVITFNLQNNANGSASSGAKSYTVVVDNTAPDGNTGTGSNDPNKSISVSAVVVADRDLTGGATATLGRVLLSTNTGSVNTTIEGGSAGDNNATRVNVNNGSASSGGVTVTRTGGTVLIDTANETATVGVVGNFSTVGAKSGSVNAASLLTNGETAITGRRGQCPYELLGLRLPTSDWWQLLHTSLANSTQELSSSEVAI